MKVTNPNECPSGGWRYEIPELQGAAAFVKAFNKPDLLTEIRVRYRANRILPPPNLSDLVEDYMCKVLPPGYCDDGKSTPVFAPNGKRQMRFTEALRGTQILADWAVHRLKGEEVNVTREQAEIRADVCKKGYAGEKCPENIPVENCVTCKLGNWLAALAQISGNKPLSEPEKIGGCNVCGCGLQGKLWITKSILNRRLTDEQKAKYPAHCWIIRPEIT